MSGADSVRFCGKIFGTKCDYWIASGRLDKAEEKVNDVNFEKRGQGVNKFVYWVSTNLLSDWIQLPDVRPEHIIAARKIRHVFTGDLNATFDSNPAFPGKERHLLRAQLARIFHATAIVPKDYYEPDLDEETKELKLTEDYEMPATADLASLENWVNLHPGLLKIGRSKHIYDDDNPTPEEWSDEQTEKYNEMKEADPEEEKFRALNEHAPMKGLEFSWTSKIVGDQQQYNLPPPKDGVTSYAVNVIRSLRWPGALTVAKSGKFLNFYVGFGMKKGDSSFQPTEPPEVCADPDETEMQDEPTPKEAPEELPEEDTDKEEDKEEDDE
jgi:radial spoke head protein 4/6